ncbi:MAG: ABC transporter permease subunit [Oligoflexales bacterium]
MKAFAAVVGDSFLRLRRDKLFFPAIMTSIILFCFASLASDWVIEEVYKVLFDIGFSVFHITGVLVAAFFGSKLLADTSVDGSIEVQLASPMSRATWLLGSYVGLSCALLLLGAILIASWQGIMYAFGFGPLKPAFLHIFLMMMVIWLIIGAVSIMFGCFNSFGVSLFSSLGLWVIGMITAPISLLKVPEGAETTSKITKTLAFLWDLRQFNLADYAFLQSWRLPPEVVIQKLTYAGSLIGLFLLVACIIFSRRDIT